MHGRSATPIYTPTRSPSLPVVHVGTRKIYVTPDAQREGDEEEAGREEKKTIVRRENRFHRVNISFTKRLSLRSTHETFLIKRLIKDEKEEIKKFTEKASA